MPTHVSFPDGQLSEVGTETGGEMRDHRRSEEERRDTEYDRKRNVKAKQAWEQR